MTTHSLKAWSEFWEAIECGDKTFELRLNDRGYQKGDILLLKKWSREYHCYTKPYDPLRVEVTYVAHGGRYGLKDDWVCMGIKLVEG